VTKPPTELLERLKVPDAVLSRADLRELGWTRRAVDAIFRECTRRDGVIMLPGYSRPALRVASYLEVIAESTYGRDRVAPGRRTTNE
jgi:hypothetical protein